MTRIKIRTNNPVYVECVANLIELSRLRHECLSQRRQKTLYNKVKRAFKTLSDDEAKDLLYFERGLDMSFAQMKNDEIKELLENIPH